MHLNYDQIENSTQNSLRFSSNWCLNLNGERELFMKSEFGHVLDKEAARLAQHLKLMARHATTVRFSILQRKINKRKILRFLDGYK